MEPGAAARSFLERIGDRDVKGALDLAAPDATVELVPLGLSGTLRQEGRGYLDALVEAFAGLTVRIPRFFVTADGTAVAEVTVDGVQGADFLGIVNQEKHLDVDQVWL